MISKRCAVQTTFMLHKVLVSHKPRLLSTSLCGPLRNYQSIFLLFLDVHGIVYLFSGSMYVFHLFPDVANG